MSRQLGLLSACCLAFALLATSALAAPRAGGEDQPCGGVAGLTCNSGLYCEMGAGQCLVADASGICKRKPGVCYGVSKPVCGCDGKTYQSDCRAHEAGKNVATPGVCPKK